MIDGLYKYYVSTAKWSSGTINVFGNFVPEVLSNVIALIDPAHNHLTYFQHYNLYPGIPWIEPHLRNHYYGRADFKTLIH